MSPGSDARPHTCSGCNLSVPSSANLKPVAPGRWQLGAGHCLQLVQTWTSDNLNSPGDGAVEGRPDPARPEMVQNRLDPLLNGPVPKPWVGGWAPLNVDQHWSMLTTPRAPSCAWAGAVGCAPGWRGGLCTWQAPEPSTLVRLGRRCGVGCGLGRGLCALRARGVGCALWPLHTLVLCHPPWHRVRGVSCVNALK